MTVPDVDRAEPDGLVTEREMLDGWLGYYRASLIHKCAGLTPEQLAKRSCAPSPMSLAGLIRHMTEMERAYGYRLANLTTGPLYCTEDSPEGDFHDAAAGSAMADLQTFDDHCGQSRRIMGTYQLDDNVRQLQAPLAALGLPLPDQGVRPAPWSRRPAPRTRRRRHRRVTAA